MTRFSIDVTAKITSCLFVLTALWEQGPSVTSLVLERLQPTLAEGETPPDFMAQLNALGKMLKAALDRMVRLDRKLVDESDVRASLIKARGGDIGKLRQKVSGLRRIVVGCYSTPLVEELGLVGSYSREPIALLRQSELVCERLQSEDVEKMLGEPLFEPPIDPRPYAEQIEPELDSVRQSFEAHQRSRRRVDQLLADKKEAIQEYDVAFLRVARQFEDLCRLAGESDLADKVRPSTKRPGETEAEPPGDETAQSTDAEDHAEAGADLPESVPADSKPAETARAA